MMQGGMVRAGYAQADGRGDADAGASPYDGRTAQHAGGTRNGNRAHTRRGGCVQTPVDYIAWTQRAAELARRPDLNAQQHSVWLTGKVSPRAQRELTALGWTVHEEVRKEKP
jgi:Tfp pilus assembly protein PilV